MTRSIAMLLAASGIVAMILCCSSFGSNSEPVADSGADSAADSSTDTRADDALTPSFCKSRQVAKGCWDFELGSPVVGFAGKNIWDGGYLDLDDKITPQPGHSLRVGLGSTSPLCAYANLVTTFSGMFSELHFELTFRLGDAAGKYEPATPMTIAALGIRRADRVLVYLIDFAAGLGRVHEQYLFEDGGSQNDYHQLPNGPLGEWRALSLDMKLTTGNVTMTMDGSNAAIPPLRESFGVATTIDVGVGLACASENNGPLEVRLDDVVFDGK